MRVPTTGMRSVGPCNYAEFISSQTSQIHSGVGVGGDSGRSGRQRPPPFLKSVLLAAVVMSKQGQAKFRVG